MYIGAPYWEEGSEFKVNYDDAPAGGVYCTNIKPDWWPKSDKRGRVRGYGSTREEAFEDWEQQMYSYKDHILRHRPTQCNPPPGWKNGSLGVIELN